MALRLRAAPAAVLASLLTAGLLLVLLQPAPVQASSAVGLRSSAFSTAAAVTSIAIPRPAGVQAGDLLLASIDIAARPTVTPPPGWQRVRDDFQGKAALKTTWFRVAGSSESAEYRWTFGARVTASGAAFAFTGTDGTVGTALTSGTTANNASAVTAPSVTTTANGGLVIGLFAATAATSIAPPSGMSGVGTVTARSGSTAVTTTAARLSRPQAGPTGSQTATAALRTTMLAQLVALQPKAAPEPDPTPTTAPPTGGAPIAYAFEPASGCTRPCAEHSSIWTQQPDGSGAARVTTPSEAFDRFPRWSPDGSRLAFTRTSWATGSAELFLADVTTAGFSAPRRVTNTATLYGGRGCDPRRMVPVWAPDSKRLAVTCADGANHASAVLVATTEGTQFTVAPESGMSDWWPTWSPDGSALAFARRDLAKRFGDAGRVRVWRTAVGATSTTSAAALTAATVNADYPTWAPSGDRIAFVEHDDLSLRPVLRTMRGDGGDVRTAFTGASTGVPIQLYDAVWSPDASRLAFPVGDGVRSSVIHVTEIATGSTHAISPSAAVAYAPRWSPDGSSVLFDTAARSDSGVETHQLSVAARDSSAFRSLPITGGFAYDADWRVNR